jgi:protoporphyrinogen oxidase
MARLLPPLSTRYGCELVEIVAESKSIAFSNGESADYEDLVLSLPLPQIVALLRNPPVELLRAAENLLYTSVFVVSFGIQGPVPPWSLLRFPRPDTGFYRLSFPAHYAPDIAPEGHSVVMGELSHHCTRHPLTPGEARDQFHRGIEQLGILQRGQKIVVENIREIRHAHILYNHSTRASIRSILEYLGSKSIFVCGKYGLWKDMLIPQSIGSGQEVAREIISHM